MKNKFIIIIGISLLSLSGISYADVLDNYGTINGTANVSGPEFYIGSVANETLLINENSSNCGHEFHLQGSSANAFITEGDLGGVNFSYIPRAKFSVRAKVNTTTTQDLTLRFGYIGDNGPITICETNVSVGKQMDNYTTDFIECSGKPLNVKKFYYEIKGNCEDCKYIIGKCADGFYTKVGLSK